MNLTSTALIVVVASITACSVPVDSNDGEDTNHASEEALISGTHFNFAASPLAGPSGPSYFTQARPLGSEVPDIVCPGPTYMPTDRIIDSNGVRFTGSAGSCDGSYKTLSNGRIVVYCKTAIQKHVCGISPATN